MIHLQVRAFGRVYTVGDDALWKGRGLGWFWTDHSAACKEYHARGWVLWVAQATEGARRFEWECGRLSVSF